MEVDYSDYSFTRNDVTVECGREVFDENNPNKKRGSFVIVTHNPSGINIKEEGNESQVILLLRCFDKINKALPEQYKKVSALHMCNN